MQVFVGGMPAYAAFSTCVWQYWHWRPRPSTWCLWLNGIGWSGRWPCLVTHGDRCSWFRATPSAMTIRPVNTRLMRASAFELRSKTCAMSAFPASSLWIGEGVQGLWFLAAVADQSRNRHFRRPFLHFGPNFLLSEISSIAVEKGVPQPTGRYSQLIFLNNIRLSKPRKRPM